MIQTLEIISVNLWQILISLANLVLIFLAYYVATGQVQPHWGAWLLLPLILLELGMLGLGCGIIISACTTNADDTDVGG